MSARGFLPFTTVGFLLLILVVAMLGQLSWDTHRAEIARIDESAGRSLLGEVASVQNDLEQTARYSAYDALWEICKRASDYSGDGAAQARERAIERSASQNFNELLTSVANARDNLGSPARLDIGRAATIDLRQGEEGSVIVTIFLPDETIIGASTPDNSFGLALPYESFEVPVAPRYYLLEDRMRRFVNDLDSIGTKWAYAEYAMAYAGAWLGSGVTLSAPRSRALFQLAWADHEFSTFGSCDYPATARDLIGIDGAAEVLEGYDPNVVIEPLSATQIRSLVEGIDASLVKLEHATSELLRARNRVSEAGSFGIETWADSVRRRFEEVRAALESGDAAGAKRKFRELAENFELTYSLPSLLLEESSSGIVESGSSVQGAETQFQQVLNRLESSAQNNPFMEQLHESLTGGDSAIARQISSGAADVAGRLDLLESDVRACEAQLRAPTGLSDIFPSDWEERFSQRVDENLTRAVRLLEEAREQSEMAIAGFEQFLSSKSETLTSSSSLVSSEVSRLLREPGSNWSEEYAEYPNPGDDPTAPPATRTAEGYAIKEREGTIGGLRLVLNAARTQLGQMEELAESFESISGELTELEVDDELKRAISSDFQFPPSLSREQAYELAPPAPISPDPGISVFHEFEIKNIEYRREDPVGWLGLSSPTPIPLWFIGVTIYWAQWNVVLELEDGAVEEIFDYENPSLPRPVVEGDSGGLGMAHKPLAYRHELPSRFFSFRLVVLGLRTFGIEYEE